MTVLILQEPKKKTEAMMISSLLARFSGEVTTAKIGSIFEWRAGVIVSCLFWGILKAIRLELKDRDSWWSWWCQMLFLW